MSADEYDDAVASTAASSMTDVETSDHSSARSTATFSTEISTTDGNVGGTYAVPSSA